MMNLFNIGFPQKTAEEFFGILKKNKIDCLVDIRLNPDGQLSRFAFEKDLPFFLDKLVDGCKYVHRIDFAPKKELLKEVRTKGSAMSKDYKLFEKHIINNWKENRKLRILSISLTNIKMLFYFAQNPLMKNVIEECLPKFCSVNFIEI